MSAVSGFTTRAIIIHLRKVSFFTGRGAPENCGGIRYFFLDQKVIKRFFQIKKGGSLIFFKRSKIFC